MNERFLSKTLIRLPVDRAPGAIHDKSIDLQNDSGATDTWKYKLMEKFIMPTNGDLISKNIPSGYENSDAICVI